MEDLLRNDFTAHYGLSKCTVTNLINVTSDSYFEIEDTDLNEITLHTSNNVGMAKISNPNNMEITIANYDKFVSNLPSHFQEGRKRCDVLISCNSEKYFVLGELKDRDISNSKKSSKIRKEAKRQLLQSLGLLLTVPTILNFINAKSQKRCCYFNKQAIAPSLINAVAAFNRLANVFPDGFKMGNPDFESLNFEFWEYTGNQTLTLTLNREV